MPSHCLLTSSDQFRLYLQKNYLQKTHYHTCTWQTHCLAPLRKEQSEQLSPEVVNICDERDNVLVCPCKFPSHLNGLLCNDLFSFTIICVAVLAFAVVGFVVFHFKPITSSPHYTKSLNKTLSHLIVIYKLFHILKIITNSSSVSPAFCVAVSLEVFSKKVDSLFWSGRLGWACGCSEPGGSSGCSGLPGGCCGLGEPVGSLKTTSFLFRGVDPVGKSICREGWQI